MIIRAGLSLAFAILCGTPGGMNNVGARFGVDQFATHMPLAFAFQHIEGFFLDAVNVSAGGKTGRQRPVEHGRMLGVLSGHKEHQRLAGQRDLLALAGHADDCFRVHGIFSVGFALHRATRPFHHGAAAPPGREMVAKKLQNVSERGRPPVATAYEFGPFRLDADAEILFRDAQPIVLGQRAVALLRLLLEHAGSTRLEGYALRSGMARSCGRRQQPDRPNRGVTAGVRRSRRR